MDEGETPKRAVVYLKTEDTARPDAFTLNSDVFREEVDAINSRRGTYGIKEVPHPHEPSSNNGLIGLAFSGGGIRSASVNLGVLQGFDESGVLERLDYLSTVSGGGFAGGALSTALMTAEPPSIKSIKISLHVLHDLDGENASISSTVVQIDWKEIQQQGFEAEFQLPQIVESRKPCVLLKASVQIEEVEDDLPISISLLQDNGASWHKTCVDRGAWGISLGKAEAGPIRLKIAKQPFPSAFKRPSHKPESVAMRHIRENTNYLKPSGVFSGLRIPAFFLMGITTNVFAILPLLLAFATATYLLWSQELQQALCTNTSEFGLDGTKFGKGQFTLKLSQFLVMPESCLRSDDGGSGEQKESIYFVNLLNLPESAVVIENTDTVCRKINGSRSQTLIKCQGSDLDLSNTTLNIGLQVFDDAFIDTVTLTIRAWQYPLPKPLFHDLGPRARDGVKAEKPLEVAAAAAAAKITFSDDLADYVTRLKDDPTDPISDLSSWLIFATVALIFFLLFLVAYPMWKPFSKWATRDFVTRILFGTGIMGVLALAVAGLQPSAVYLFVSLIGAPTSGFIGGFGDMLVFWMCVATAAGGLLVRSDLVKDFARKVLIYAVAILGFLTVWMLSAWLTLWLLDCQHLPLYRLLAAAADNQESSLHFLAGGLNSLFNNLGDLQQEYFKTRWFGNWHQCSLLDPSTELATMFIALSGGLWFLTSRRFNVNKTSFHHFYRDRLSAAFSINPWHAEASHVDDVPMADLATDRGPFHIVNATLNLPRTNVAALKGRRCDFFVFTPLRVGGQLTGYCESREYAEVEGRFDLNSAVAISGAAAAPTMGVNTNRAMVFLMALLNVRLDYWAHNPNLHIQTGVKHRPVGAKYLLREMLGILDEETKFINLSDGGHIENLGVYELIRRRCKFIICSDCAADKDMRFDDLADLIRLVRIDMGVEINIDPKPIEIRKGKRKSRQGLSDQHFVVGEIDYPDNEKGLLIYLKASLTGDEDLYIKNYRAGHTAFPNESTADQFYDEAQFEAYRALGQHIARTFFASKTAKALFRHEEVTVDEVLSASNLIPDKNSAPVGKS